MPGRAGPPPNSARTLRWPKRKKEKLQNEVRVSSEVRIGPDIASGPLLYGLLSCRASAVGTVLLAMQIASVRRRMERKHVLKWYVIRIHAVAQLGVRRDAKALHKHACQSAQPNVHHVIDGTPPTERPPCVVPGEWTQPVLTSGRRRRNRKI